MSRENYNGKLPLVAIVGTTASGKSDLAMRLAEHIGGEIICVDSRTVYRGLDIGAAKPGHADQTRVPHHMLDIVGPGQTFGVSDFKKVAVELIETISKRQRIPIMVGGTGLYMDAVLFDYKFGGEPDQAIRCLLENKDVEELQQICRQNDIEMPVNLQNKRHLVRAIELGGLVNHPKVLRSNTIVVGITTDRDVLRGRVVSRLDQMLKAGLLAEVENVVSEYGIGSEVLKGNVYSIFSKYLEGKLDYQQAIEDSISSDMRLAKRQATWLKRNKFVVWGTAEELESMVCNFVGQQKTCYN
jgi:tRNA dimethylallyltransferase